VGNRAPSAETVLDAGPVSIFEPGHGPAPDVAGQGLANPIDALGA
jgi:isocitrate/isopropylmalate dehydrogenase